MHLLFQKRAKKFFRRLICWWTGGEHFHVGLLFDGVTVLEANDVNGVCLIQTNGIFDPNEWDLVHIPMTEDQESAMRAFVKDEVGSEYDWFGLWMAQVFGIARESNTKWFCSELAVAALKSVGLMKDKVPCRYSPEKLYRWAAAFRWNGLHTPEPQEKS